MDNVPSHGFGRLPSRVVLATLIALAVPGFVGVVSPSALGGPGALLAVIPLVAVVVLASERGWRGALLGGVAGLAVLLGVQILGSIRGNVIPPEFSRVTVGFAVVTLGIAWLAAYWDRERATIEELAYTNLLTGIPNRRLVGKFFETDFHDAMRGRALSIVLFDLDEFKRFNDEHGHEAGDEALRVFAEVLATTTRKSCISGRLGGEEFLSILPGIDVEGAAIFAERVRAGIQAREMEYGVITVSAGVAGFEREMKAPEELMAAADQALYAAKRDGRNCVRIYGRPSLADLMPKAHRTPSDDDEDVETSLAEEASGAARGGRRTDPVTMGPHEITGFGSGREVLVVEPDPAVRSLVNTYLTKEGLEVLQASDADTATRQLETEPDLVIVSLGEDAPDGIRLVAGVKARWPNTPVVALADPQSPDLVTEALASGADRYLFKPFPMAELGRSLEALLRLRTARLQSWESRQWSSDFPETVRGHLEEALDRLVAAAEARETGAAGRSHRAAALAHALAESVNAVVPNVEVDPPSVAFAARLMGIGRTAVPAELLQRDGALSAEELSEVRMAARRGAAMLESLCLPPVVVGAVRWHDIRWDGEGQSEVLGGRAIPMEARILGIVWNLEAMTRDRPYRAAISWSEAVEEITRDMGHRFDPGLSEAFHEALPRLEQAIEEGSERNRAEPPEGE